MTNLDSMFKSRDITLPTKVRLVKAMIFPVVMYGCESWTVKKAECQRIDAFVFFFFFLAKIQTVKLYKINTHRKAEHHVSTMGVGEDS